MTTLDSRTGKKKKNTPTRAIRAQRKPSRLSGARRNEIEAGGVSVVRVRKNVPEDKQTPPAKSKRVPGNGNTVLPAQRTGNAVPKGRGGEANCLIPVAVLSVGQPEKRTSGGQKKFKRKIGRLRNSASDGKEKRKRSIPTNPLRQFIQLNLSK